MATVLIYLGLAVLLILLNAFFVLAEFAAVKIRASQVEALAAKGDARAKLVLGVRSHLDEYLSVCQVGITFASIGLGFVGEPAFADLIIRLTGAGSKTAHSIAVGLAYVLVSFLHILIGELVPKSLAIRRAEGAALITALPLRFFRAVFYVPLTVLNGATNGVLRLIGITGAVKEEEHSEEELRLILAQSQNVGLMSFRRLLLLENIFDLGDVKVRDAMRPRDVVKVLKLGAAFEENLKVVRDSRFSRFPLMDGGALPIGVVHVKDLFYEPPDRLPTADLKKMARAYVTLQADAPLENALGELQRTRSHLAMVKDAAGKWVGVLSMEDIVEEIVGTIEDEFETEPPIYLADALTPGRVVLGLQGSSLEEVVGQAFGSVPTAELPLAPEKIVKAVLERERAMSTYLGNGLAIPHARLEGIDKPALLFARSDEGIPIKGREEKAHLIFILMTPAGSPRVQVRLLARICGLIASEYVAERLRSASTPAGVVEAIRAAEPMTIS
ncbi:MAG TPA: CNNM domain-containing protein [Planctomycetota bacterium]|nr:CNNM domain-containing protein [Planctomycetota bacterium]